QAALAALQVLAAAAAATPMPVPAAPVANAVPAVAPAAPKPPPAPVARAHTIVIPRLGLSQPVGWYSHCLGRAPVPRWGAGRWRAARSSTRPVSGSKYSLGLALGSRPKYTSSHAASPIPC